MARKIVTTNKVNSNAKTRELEPVTDAKRDRFDVKSLLVTDAKEYLRNAISEVVSDEVRTGNFPTIKEAKRHRRDVIVNTIMKHTR